MNKITYLSVRETAKRWCMSERSVRNYCLQGRIVGALLEGNTWNIPSDAEKPHRKIRHTAKQDTLLSFLKREKETGLKGGIYHKIQIDLTYNSNHIEGSKLTHDQTRFIFETKTLGVTDEVVRVADIIETVNHFHCIDVIIEGAHTKLSKDAQFFYPAASFTTARYRSILSIRTKACGVRVSMLSCGVCIRCHVCGMTAANGEP